MIVAPKTPKFLWQTLYDALAVAYEIREAVDPTADQEVRHSIGAPVGEVHSTVLDAVDEVTNP